MGKARTGKLLTCPVCDGTFYAAGWQIARRKPGRVFCSPACGYTGRLRLPALTEAERFWPRVVKTPHCWYWTGAKNNGYGAFTRTQMPGEPKRGVPAHVWSWEQVHGPVPAGHDLDHTCHTGTGCRGGRLCIHRACVRPDHLEPVSRRLRQPVRDQGSWSVPTNST